MIGIINVLSRFGQRKAGVEKAPVVLAKLGLMDILPLHTKKYDVCISGKEEGSFPLYNLKSICKVTLKTQEMVRLCLFEECFPLIIGGDHSISIGSISAISEKYEDLGVIWYDAHLDMNTDKTTPSGNIHGMSLAVLLGYGANSLVSLVKKKIDPRRVVVIGAHSMDEGEKEFVKKHKIRVFPMKEIKEKGINEVIEEALVYLQSVTKHIHLSFDIDSLDPQFCPGTGVPVLGGLSVEETLSAFTLLRESNLVIGMDVVEINPLLDKDNLTSKVAITLIKEFFKK